MERRSGCSGRPFRWRKRWQEGKTGNIDKGKGGRACRNEKQASRIIRSRGRRRGKKMKEENEKKGKKKKTCSLVQTRGGNKDEENEFSRKEGRVN